VLDLGGGMSRVLAETDENGTIQAYYVYGLGLISRITPDESRHFYHYNNREDTIALTDVSGNVTDSYSYDEYGKLLLESTCSTENPFKFVGRYGVMDEGDNFYFMRARFYDAEAGRFLNEDPLGFEGGDWNLYAYVGGNPLMRIDPSGLRIASSWYQQINAAIYKQIAPVADKVFSAFDSGLYWSPYQSVKSSVEIVKNWWPVAKDMQNINSGDEPQTWGGRSYKLKKCDDNDVNDVLDCYYSQ